jgi:predicted lipid-binding transport protein (Tim44 family)
MKTWIVGACIAALAASLSLVPIDADAKKRFGGGQNSGMQRDMPTRNAPDAPPAKPATPAPGAQPGAAAPAAAAGATAAATAAKKSSWLGPIAGIAAAVGLVALMSSMGLGEEFANFLMLALVGMAGLFLVLWLMRRFGKQNAAASPALAGAGAGAGSGALAGSTASPSWNKPADASPMQREATPNAPSMSSLQPAATSSGSQPFVPAWPTPGTEAAVAPSAGRPIAFERGHVPADFDTAGFERVASMIFIRMQAAYDAADLNDLRSFTTPEMYASVKVDLQGRQGGASQHTEVEKVLAEVLDVATEEGRQIVSVRYHGQLREDGETASESFDEVWHLVKPLDNSRSWAIAGIQQQPSATH